MNIYFPKSKWKIVFSSIDSKSSPDRNERNSKSCGRLDMKAVIFKRSTIVNISSVETYSASVITNRHIGLCAVIPRMRNIRTCTSLTYMHIMLASTSTRIYFDSISMQPASYNISSTRDYKDSYQPTVMKSEFLQNNADVLHCFHNAITRRIKRLCASSNPILYYALLFC